MRPIDRFWRKDLSNMQIWIVLVYKKESVVENLPPLKICFKSMKNYNFIGFEASSVFFNEFVSILVSLRWKLSVIQTVLKKWVFFENSAQLLENF